jgi:hypothetical protein
VCVVVLHAMPARQLVLVKHSTHIMLVVSQTGVAAVRSHCVLLVQDVTQAFVVVLHTVPVAQFEFAVHSTHRLVCVSQTVSPAA